MKGPSEKGDLFAVLEAFNAITEDDIMAACRAAYFPKGMKLSELEDLTYFQNSDSDSDSSSDSDSDSGTDTDEDEPISDISSSSDDSSDSSKASSSGEHVQLFRMVYDRKKGFQSEHL